MQYKRLEKNSDKDVGFLKEIHSMPEIKKHITIDENNYWTYVTENENVFYYKCLQDEKIVATLHIEVCETTAYLSILVLPEYQKKGIGSAMLKDVQNGLLVKDFETIEASIDETNIASIKLFEKCGFEFVEKEDELLTYIYKL